MDVYLEIGQRRTFAVALDWPGWCRSGRDEESALAALLAYGDRYRRVINDAPDPAGVAVLSIVERLPGDSTTDFGAPGAMPTSDFTPPDDAELAFLGDVMDACWAAFDRAADGAVGRQLAPAGPRGGGRDVDKLVEHVGGAEDSYLRALGGTVPKTAGRTEVRRSFLDALGARARGELPATGPRGGQRWPARYAARRAAWHLLDHAWELEDRLR